MKTLCFAALALVLTAPTAFARTVCTNASGELQYVSENNFGGAPPGPGDLISVITVSYRGVLQSESKAYKGKDPQLGPINPDFSEKRILKKDTHGDTFSAKLSLTKNTNTQSTDEPQITVPSDTYVICQVNTIAAP